MCACDVAHFNEADFKTKADALAGFGQCGHPLGRSCAPVFGENEVDTRFADGPATLAGGASPDVFIVGS